MKTNNKSGVFAALRMAARAHYPLTVGTLLCVATSVIASLLPPLLRLTRVHNYGAAWSSFSGARWLLIILTAVGMCVLAWLLVKVVRHPLGQWSLACILGGGIGNLIDRVRLGYVVDMLDTMFMDFPVFNVADVFVVCGTICALIYYLAFYRKYDEKHRENKTDGTDPAANK